MLKKLLTSALSPLPTRNTMGVVALIAVFTAGFAIGANAVAGAEQSPDMSSELVSIAEEDAAEATAQTSGIEQTAMAALYDGVIIPLMVISGEIAEIGVGVGHWTASMFGVGVAKAVGNGLAVSMLAIAAYDVATDIRDVEASA